MQEALQLLARCQFHILWGGLWSLIILQVLFIS